MKCAIILVGFQRFDKGTIYTICYGSKFVILSDDTHNLLSLLEGVGDDDVNNQTPTNSNDDVTFVIVKVK